MLEDFYNQHKAFVTAISPPILTHFYITKIIFLDIPRPWL